MAKELPYFKFEPSEWQNGNIQMCSELTQLYFINMCCTYWSKLGNLNKKLALVKCFNSNNELFNELLENKIITVNDGQISISFLDKQLVDFKTKKKVKADSGRKGGLNNGVRPEIERISGNQLYLLECWNNEERFYKMGTTTNTISRRYSGKIQYQYKVVFQIFTDKFIEAEKELCELLRNYEYKPLLNFAGQKECYIYSENQAIESIINKYFNFTKASLLRNDTIREDKIIEYNNKDISGVETPPIDYKKFIDYFNSFANRNFRVTQKIKKTLNARLKNYTKKQLQDAIKIAHEDEYHKKTNFKYLTPELILREDKLERFLNNPKKEKNISFTSMIPLN